MKHKNAVSSKIAPETAEMLSYDAPQNNETEKPASSARKPLGESRPHSKLPISKAERAAERAAEKAAEKAAEASTVASERATLEAFLENARSDLTAKLAKIEADIDTQEEDYIRSTWAHGNVLRGWDGFGRRVDRAEKLATGNGSGVSTGAPKHRKARPSDRIFSLSSSSSNFRKENPDVLIQKRSATTKKKKKR